MYLESSVTYAERIRAHPWAEQKLDRLEVAVPDRSDQRRFARALVHLVKDFDAGGPSLTMPKGKHGTQHVNIPSFSRCGVKGVVPGRVCIFKGGSRGEELSDELIARKVEAMRGEASYRSKGRLV